MDLHVLRTRDQLETCRELELSFVELVVAASEQSEDEQEVADLVDGLLASGRVRLRPEELAAA
jgi:hypothetical protein